MTDQEIIKIRFIHVILVSDNITIQFNHVILVSDNKAEREGLTFALSLTKDILSYVDLQVDAHEKEQKLFEIYNKLDARQSTLYKGKKFKVREDEKGAWEYI